MRQTMREGRTCSGLLLGVLVGLLGGCDIALFDPGPPPEGVLEGVWNLTEAEDSSLTSLSLTFDSRGALTKVVYRISDNTTLTDSRPRGDTEVDGQNVTISTTFGLNTLRLTGTFDENQLVITGDLETEVSLGGLSLLTENGTAVLTRE